METIIIAIVIGIISSIYNQIKNQNGNQKKPSTAKPFTAGGPRNPKRQEVTVHKEMERPEREKKKQRPIAHLGEIEAKYAEEKKKAEEQIIALKKQQAAIEQKARQIRNSVENSDLSISNIAHIDSNKSISVEESNLLNGIIFRKF